MLIRHSGFDALSKAIISTESKTIVDNLMVNSNVDAKTVNTPQIYFSEILATKLFSTLFSQDSHFSKKVAIDNDISYQTDSEEFKSILNENIQRSNVNIIFSEENTTNNLDSHLLTKNQHTYIQNKVNKALSSGAHSYIGIQKHLSDSESFETCEVISYDFIRLGQFRNDPVAVESILRDSEIIEFDINCIRNSDLVENISSGICGFTMEEACQLMFFAGMSSKLGTIVIKGINKDAAKDSKHYDAVALLFWYFLEGFESKEVEETLNKANCQEFIIDLPNSEDTVMFYQSKISGKWWFQKETDDKEYPIFACAESDYLDIANNRVSQRVEKFLERSMN